ncbi:FRG1-like family-domain-containing protein [Staphylotrichum tortipilum]|uniref:FRG1-like family-domain-containing protein n=1 Tax=Staphylotrichum tortipilum TaxID=2831512 RepID=A0AAN6RRU1_9PEZI|nr:FRG1-like family-domain-containing protein [Staphylotrichum longicolle]
MVKPLTFKGDKKPKKRKRADAADGGPSQGDTDNPERQLKAPKPSTSAAANDDEAATEDDTWVSADAVSDISGPILIVLPSDPPTALACDAAGKVFAHPIENIVDANPATAEPHDVRQVWVANKIIGTDDFRIKGHHGKYLSADKIGLLTATSTAITPLETFTLLPTPSTPSTFQIQTQRLTYLSVHPPRSSRPNAPPEVRADQDEVEFSTTLRVRMQARFKPRLRASKEEKAREKISRSELEEAVGRRLEEGEVKMLKRARREGDYHEVLLDLKVKGKHDKFG